MDGEIRMARLSGSPGQTERGEESRLNGPVWAFYRGRVGRQLVVSRWLHVSDEEGKPGNEWPAFDIYPWIA